jgi:hypothetical protein
LIIDEHKANTQSLQVSKIAHANLTARRFPILAKIPDATHVNFAPIVSGAGVVDVIPNKSDSSR